MTMLKARPRGAAQPAALPQDLEARLAADLELAVIARRDRPEPTHRATRSDALPEHVEYRDDGCDLFPSCLSCPLARCRYDVPGGVRALLNRERDRQMRALRDDAGLSVDEIADRFQVSRRTVFRALAVPGSRGCTTREAR